MNHAAKKEVVSKRYCNHASQEISLKTTYVFPADIFPETPPRLNDRSCSHYFDCNLQDKTACTYLITP